MITSEFLLEQSTKVNESSEGSISRPRWSAIIFGKMLTEEHIVNASYQAWVVNA